MRAAASLLFALGSSLREIQETLGHAEVALTREHLHPRRRRGQRAAADRLGAFLRGEPGA